MKSDLTDLRAFLPWLPVPVTLETGDVAMRWQLDVQSRYRTDGNFTSPIDLNYQDVFVEIQWISETSCALLCRASAKSSTRELHDSGYRGILAVDRYFGSVSAVNGVDRSDVWFIILAHYAEPGGPQMKDMTALMKCAQSNDLSRMNELIGNRANINATDLVGATALSFAARSGSYSAFKLLLEHNATPTAVSADGSTLVHSAALGGNVEILSELVRLRLDLDTLDMAGNTPLALAIFKRNAEAAATLLRAGANPAAQRGVDICQEARSNFGANHPITLKVCRQA